MRLRSALLATSAFALVAGNARAVCPSLASLEAPGSTCAGPVATPVPQSWFVGVGSPPTVPVVPGEIYVVASTGEEWTIANGAWVDSGDTLSETLPAAVHYYGGAGAPLVGTGIIGDVYIQSGGEVWSDTGGGWVDSGFYLKGLDGWPDAAVTLPIGTTPGLLLQRGGVSAVESGVTPTSDSTGLLVIQERMTPVDFGSGTTHLVGTLPQGRGWDLYLSGGAITFGDITGSGSYESATLPGASLSGGPGLSTVVCTVINKSSSVATQCGMTVPSGSMGVASSKDGSSWTAIGSATGLSVGSISPSSGQLYVGNFESSDGFVGIISSIEITDGSSVLANPAIGGYVDGATSIPDTSVSGLSWTPIGVATGG